MENTVYALNIVIWSGGYFNACLGQFDFFIGIYWLCLGPIASASDFEFDQTIFRFVSLHLI